MNNKNQGKNQNRYLPHSGSGFKGYLGYLENEKEGYLPHSGSGFKDPAVDMYLLMYHGISRAAGVDLRALSISENKSCQDISRAAGVD